MKHNYNVIVHETDDEIVFTTNDRDAAKLLELVCDEANITDNSDEYHYQGWVSKKK